MFTVLFNKSYNTAPAVPPTSFANATSAQFVGSWIFPFCHFALANLLPELLSQMGVVYQAKLTTWNIHKINDLLLLWLKAKTSTKYKSSLGQKKIRRQFILIKLSNSARNSLKEYGPILFDPKLTWPKLLQTERTRRLACLPNFCKLVQEKSKTISD